MTTATPVDTAIVGNQRFLCQKDNYCASATITASATKTASGTVTASDPVRVGNSLGVVGLSGAYTGADDASFDVEIRSGAGTTRRTSQPAFTGSGSGTAMSAVTATSGVPAQQVTVKLIDLGTADKYAKVDFYGYALRSKIPQSGGNQITVTNDRSGITYTASGNTTPADMSQDDYRFEGPGFDFGGAYELDADGQLNPLTRRFAFGSDPRVYRQYRRFEDSKEIYIIDPPLARDVDDLSTVKTVSGTYSVTVAVSTTDTTWTAATAYAVGDIVIDGGKVYQVITAGTSDGTIPTFDDSTLGAETTDNTVTWAFVAAVATETYAGLTTFFDLLKALLSSQLVELLSPGDTPPVITQDKTPGGTDAEDIPFLTDSFHLGFRTDGSDNIATVQDINLDASGATRNEQLSITCTSNSTLGQELWSVRGSGGGNYGQAITGQLFSASGLEFLIPGRDVEDATGSSTAAPIGGDVIISDYAFDADDGVATTFPQACIREYALGPNAKPMTITFTYRPRPDAACDCEAVELSEHVDPHCVGADAVEIVNLGGESLSTIPATIQSRMSTLWAWYSGIIGDLNALFTATGPDVSYEYRYSANKVLFTSILNQFQSALYDLQDIPAGLTDYDSVFTALTTDTDLALIDDIGDTYVSLQTSGENYPGKYKSLLDVVRVDAGLQPNPNNASSAGNDDCWQDYGDSFWWIARGNDGRSYPPMFTNKPFYLTQETHGDGGAVSYPSLNIAGFLIAIGCSDSLVVGDTIEVSLLPEAGENSFRDNRFYQVGDKFIADIIARLPLQLQNGRTGDNLQTWAVFGAVAGGYANYSVNTQSPAAYSNGGLGFTITPGSIPNAIGDQFVFSVLLNQFRWRKNGGSYSSDTDIDATVSLSDGVSAVFTEGAGVSFQDGDVFSFAVEQPYSPAHSVLPTSEYWTPDSATGNIIYDFGSDQVIDMIAIAWHLIPAGASVTAELLNAADGVLYSASLTRNADVMFDSLTSAQTGVRKLKLSFTSASGFWLAWVWCGQSVYLNADADALTIKPSRLMLRGSANQPGRHIARGYTGSMEWRGAWETTDETGFLSESDIGKLIAIFESLKSNNDQPFALIPNPDYDNGWLLRWAGDEFEPVDDFAFNLAERTQRVQTTSIEFGAVYQ